MANKLVSVANPTGTPRERGRPTYRVMLYHADCREGRVFVGHADAKQALQDGWADEPKWPVAAPVEIGEDALARIVHDLVERVAQLEQRVPTKTPRTRARKAD